MSYEKIKGIRIEEGKVMINGASNNVIPLNYHWWECTTLSKILNEQGQEALDIEILNAYESGEFQGGSNKYTRALSVLSYTLKDEYKQFDWYNSQGEEYKKAQERRKTPEFKELLKKALNYKPQNEKVIIFKIGDETIFSNEKPKLFLKKETSKHLFYTRSKEEAKIFKFREEAEILVNRRKDLNLNLEVLQ